MLFKRRGLVKVYTLPEFNLPPTSIAFQCSSTAKPIKNQFHCLILRFILEIRQKYSKLWKKKLLSSSTHLTFVQREKCTKLIMCVWRIHSNGALGNHFHLLNSLIIHIEWCWGWLFLSSLRFIWYFFPSIYLYTLKRSLIISPFVCYSLHLALIFHSQITFHAKIFVHNVYFCAVQIGIYGSQFIHRMSYIFHRLYQNQIGYLTQKAQHNHIPSKKFHSEHF